MSAMLAVGSVARDTIHNPHGTHKMILGGSAVFATLAGSFFVKNHLVGVVGKDFPDDAVRLLTEHDIDISGLQVVDGKTFHWEGRYSSDLSSRETLRTDLNVFADFHPQIPEGLRDTPYIMLGNIQPDLQLEVLEQIRSPKMVIADTMNFWIEGTPDQLAKLLRRIDALVINEEEARQLANEHNTVKAGRVLLRMGPDFVVVKQGEYGALLFEHDQVFSAPAYPVEEVMDPTGAGDTFAGGMLGFVAERDSLDTATLRRAIIYGSALASFCVEGISVQRLTTLTRSDINARYLEFARLAHFATDDELKTLAT